MSEFPIPVASLIECVPHRYPAVWIDEVISTNQCRVVVREANYMENEFVRQSSYIEFMAQSYAYVVACEALKTREKISNYKKAFLVALRDIQFPSLRKIRIGESLIIEVDKTHELGPMLLINGKITLEKDGTCLAQGQIKIFVE